MGRKGDFLPVLIPYAGITRIRCLAAVWLPVGILSARHQADTPKNAALPVSPADWQAAAR